jgi:hypothetical protein
MITSISFLLSIIALIVAIIAYRRSGGSMDEMKQKVEELGITTESMRTRMADLLNSFEKKLRGEDKPSAGPSSDQKDEPPQNNA